MKTLKLHKTPRLSDFWNTPKNNNRAYPKTLTSISISGRQDAFVPSSLFQHISLMQTLVSYATKADANGTRT
ncbi:hypothetical protein [Zobellia uliginosa]|uniref:hypothetical protein n=1 Tax=Zobellia uliginosa TaxID=143224 RepID=UPI0011156FEB|nr:hypothetical protein [Zobellia uliginosa]